MQVLFNYNSNAVCAECAAARTDELFSIYERIAGHAMIAQCSKCGCEAKFLVTNSQTMTRECWECVAGPDEMMLRRVQLRTTDGYEVRCVYALNNLIAVDNVAQGRNILEFQVMPLPN